MAQTAIAMTLEFASVADLEKFRDRFEQEFGPNRVNERDRLPEGIDLWGIPGTESPSASEEESRKMTVWVHAGDIAKITIGGVLVSLLLSYSSLGPAEGSPAQEPSPHTVYVVDNYYDLSQDYTPEQRERIVQAIGSDLVEQLSKAAEESEESE